MSVESELERSQWKERESGNKIRLSSPFYSVTMKLCALEEKTFLPETNKPAVEIKLLVLVK